MAEKGKSRAEKAGEHQAESIIEMVNLMYQDHTAEKFYRGLMEGLVPELKRREIYYQNLPDFLKEESDKKERGEKHG